MEVKKEHCCTTLGALFAFIFVLVVTLPMNFQIRNFNDIWEYKGTLISQIFGGRTTCDHDHQIPITTPNKNRTVFPAEISPNRSSCHDSYGRPGLLINCCPPPDLAEAVPVDFQFPDPSKTPLKVRRPVHRIDHEYIAKYKKAITIMKSLPYSDPRSFDRQADVHCTYCTGAFDMSNSKWGLNIHREWLFYPFHRMYLYFHERILASFIGDNTFALPYWAWDNPSSMYFPNMFLHDPFSDTERDPTHFSPRLVDLAYNPLAHHENVSLTTCDNLAFMYNQMVSAATKPELFMGCRFTPDDDGYCNGPGTVELAPHNTVHTWVGSADNPGREDMGKFYSAGRDPCFYPHHANIDRLWDVWRDLHDMHVPFDDPMWLNSYFYFYDETSRLVKIKVSDVLNITKLRYSYEPIDLVWLSHRPKPSVDPRFAKSELSKRVIMSSSSSSPIISHHGQNLNSPMRVKVHMPKPRRSEREREGEEEILAVHGISIDGDVDEMVKFDVYLNLVDESKLGPRYREFVGTFTHIPQGGGDKDESRKSTTLRLGISEALKDLEADRDESIWVTLMPSSASCAKVAIGGVRIEYMK